ncbi:MAG: glycerophosphodiester phosphodiesterase [Crocinitomicaceae bacterium]|nr:glycerophosphodiester phosphodiesterase [Crocinitomicaceae bacterium]
MHFRNLLFGLMLLISACQKDQHTANTKVIGHGATGLKMPASFYHDNSLEAIHKALETEGCDGIEIDVQLSKSGTLWLFHDAEMKLETDHSGCIHSKTDEELKQVRYQTIRKEKLARFEEIPFHKLMGKTLMLDLRHFNSCESTILTSEKMLDELLKFPEIQTGSIHVYLLSNYAPWITAFQNTSFELIYSTETLEEAKVLMTNNNIAGVMIKNSQISKDQVNELKGFGKKIIIFEVRSPKNIRKALKKRPDYLVTDDLRTTIIEK